MMNMRETTDIEGFVLRFRDDPGERADLIGRLIGDNPRITLNLPRSGPARRISGLLREGPFSDFYEFEKSLARSLHPLLAKLNLNIMADILVNGLFEEKYRRYTKRFQRALAANKPLTQAALKDLLLDMVARDGHWMAVKFYDLILRPIDPDLFRRLKPVEYALMEMKNAPGRDAARTPAHVADMLSAYRRKHGADGAELLSVRMAWDDELGSYAGKPADDGRDEDVVADEAAAPRMEQGPGEDLDYLAEGEGRGDDAAEGEYTGEAARDDDVSEDAAGQGEVPEDDDVILLEDIPGRPESSGPEGPVPGEGAGRGPGTAAEARTARANVGKVARYAEVLKNDFLLLKRPEDEEGIRELVDGMYAKNEKSFGADRAAEIVHEVLSVWINDERINGWMRGILSDIVDERYGTFTVHDEPGGAGAFESGTGPVPDAAGADDGAPDGDRLIDDELIVEDIAADAGEVALGEDEATPEEFSEELTDNSEAELRALLAGADEAQPDVEPAGESGDHDALSMIEEIDHINAEDIVPVVEVSRGEGAGEEEFLVSEEEFRELTGHAGGRAGDDREEGFLADAAPGSADGLGGGELADLDLDFEAANPAGKRFAAREAAGGGGAPAGQTGVHGGAEADSFVVKDEILFEDRSLKIKKMKNGKA